MPRISELPALAQATSGDIIPIVDDAGNITKKVTANKVVPDGSVVTSQLGSNAVTTAKIGDNQVTASKIDFTTYSTNEKVVGTWIDGKPIYRRVVSFTFPASTQNISHGIGISTPISVSLIRGGQAIGAGVMHSSTEGYFVKFTETNFECRVLGTPSAYPAFVIIEYTKL